MFEKVEMLKRRRRFGLGRMWLCRMEGSGGMKGWDVREWI